MLQPAGDAFRVHDLVLRFLKLKLKADPSRPTATGRTVEYLGQLKVLQGYVGAGETSDGVYSLMALWRSVENLAEESHVAAVYTKNLHGVPDGALWNQAGRILELMVSRRSQGCGWQNQMGTVLDDALLRSMQSEVLWKHGRLHLWMYGKCTLLTCPVRR